MIRKRIAASGRLVARLMVSQTPAATRNARRAAAAVCVASVLVLLCVQMAPANAAPEWHSDGRTWSGTGSVLLPGAVHVGSHSVGQSGCEECRWLVLPACGVPVGIFCGALAAVICRPTESWFHTLFAASPRDELAVVASSCIGPDQRPISRAELDREVQQHIQAHAPPLAPRYQPAGHAVTQLPTIFATGQPRTLEQSDSILGFEIRLVARAHWHWSWGDGSTSDTRQPGGAWPDTSLAHTYRQAGSVRATVAAYWDASYSISGGESLTVAGPTVSQTAEIWVRVRQARAVLTD